MANIYLEGTYSEVYPNITQDEAGLKKLFKQFSFPGRDSQPRAPRRRPGSIHEGGELGYSLSHAFGAAFDNPDLIVACVVGDGEAETGPLATAWHSNKFLNPVRDGAVLPILHLNGYKIANPTVLARIRREELDAAVPRLRLDAATSSKGDDPATMHQLMAATLDQVIARDPRDPERSARGHGSAERPRWPMIVLRDAQGLDRARRWSTASRWRARSAPHQVPLSDPRKNPEHLRQLEAWMQSYRPEELFDDGGAAACRNWRSWRPQGERRMGANPHANGGLLLRDLRMPDFRDYARRRARARAGGGRGHARAGHVPARRDRS